jgi:hypothetical protein
MTKDNRKLPPKIDLAISCVCGLLAGLVLTVFLAGLSSPQKVTGLGITKANFDLIEYGMTQEDVEKIFGCPPGYYATYTNGVGIGLTNNSPPPTGLGMGEPFGYGLVKMVKSSGKNTG